MLAKVPPHKTLAIASARDWYHKLVWESKKLESLANDGGEEFAYTFINAALSAWHMIDWTYNDFNPEGLNRFPKLATFRDYVRAQSGYLVICREIADGSKHAVLTYKPDPNIGTTRISINIDYPAKGDDVVMWFVETKSVMHDPKQVIRSSLYYWNEFLTYDMPIWGKPGKALFGD